MVRCRSMCSWAFRFNFHLKWYRFISHLSRLENCPSQYFWVNPRSGICFWFLLARSNRSFSTADGTGSSWRPWNSTRRSGKGQGAPWGATMVWKRVGSAARAAGNWPTWSMTWKSLRKSRLIKRNHGAEWRKKAIDFRYFLTCQQLGPWQNHLKSTAGIRPRFLIHPSIDARAAARYTVYNCAQNQLTAASKVETSVIWGKWHANCGEKEGSWCDFLGIDLRAAGGAGRAPRGTADALVQSVIWPSAIAAGHAIPNRQSLLCKSQVDACHSRSPRTVCLHHKTCQACKWNVKGRRFADNHKITFARTLFEFYPQSRYSATLADDTILYSVCKYFIKALHICKLIAQWKNRTKTVVLQFFLFFCCKY